RCSRETQRNAGVPGAGFRFLLRQTLMKLLVFVLSAELAAAAGNYDLLIRNARVLDGAGNTWFRADIGVRDGKIAAIGSLGPDASAAQVVDAAGRITAPGFIDVHTHIEGSVDKVPRGDNYLLDGVTTVITGNCGGSIVKLGMWFGQLEKMGLGINVGTL